MALSSFCCAPEGDDLETTICRFCRLGRVDYLDAWTLQKELAQAVAAGEPNILLLLEHPPTYTLGARGGEANMRVPRETLELGGAAVYNVDRGGDITFHGPGQLVGYPILNLKKLGLGIRQYLRSIEEVIIQTLASYQVVSGRSEGFTGVWTEDEKIAAIGIKITAKRITQHGFALNVNTELTYFRQIVPCGITDRGVTSLSNILGREVPLAEIAARTGNAFASVFEKKMVEISPSDIIRGLRIPGAGIAA
ncbi:MAG: lipoyl(octanoyl) transferase LipB [Syntrophobacteraceae bacterium]